MPKRLMPFALSALTLAPLLAAAPVAAQDVTRLILEGRFEEAVTMSTGLTSTEADALAHRIFSEGYQRGYQDGDYAYAVRAFEAAKTIEGLTADRRRMFDFWHGVALFRSARPHQEERTVESARAALALLQAADSLLSGTEEYAEANNIRLDLLLEGLARDQQIQEDIVLYGRR